MAEHHDWEEMVGKSPVKLIDKGNIGVQIR